MDSAFGHLWFTLRKISAVLKILNNRNKIGKKTDLSSISWKWKLWYLGKKNPNFNQAMDDFPFVRRKRFHIWPLAELKADW